MNVVVFSVWTYPESSRIGSPPDIADHQTRKYRRLSMHSPAGRLQAPV